jgi:hypothetical protein
VQREKLRFFERERRLVDPKTNRAADLQGYVSIGRIVAAFTILVITILAIASIYVLASMPVSRDELIQDVRQLSNLIEAVHPDPYIRGGGKIAYHRRLHETIGAIPVG